jgi:DNA-binding transcriptional MerR regulator
MDVLTIGQLAGAAGVNVETVRFYERRGLLDSPPRSPSGYRQYSEVDLRRLELIRRAKGLGFTLSEIGALLDGRSDIDPGEAVVDLARAKIGVLDDESKRIEEVKDRLVRLITVCQDPADEDCRALRIEG